MTNSKSNQSAAPTRLLRASTLLLAAAIVFEVSGMQALSQGHARGVTATASADGSTVYTTLERSDASVVAQN